MSQSDLEAARQQLGLFDNQQPRKLFDWQATGSKSADGASAAALENATKMLAEMGDKVPLGEGWARRVYVHPINPDRALKIATGPRGIAQNKGEVMVGNGRSGMINPLTGHAPDFSWVEQVLATPFESAEAMGAHLGMSEHPDFGQLLREIVEAKQAPAGLSPQARDFYDRAHQLFEDVPELEVLDLGRYQQWGLDKNGQIVLIDYGLLKGMPLAVAGFVQP